MADGAQAPDSTEALKPRGGKLRVIVGAGALAAVVVVALIVADRRAKSKSERAIAEQFSSLETCLVGKLDAGESVSHRLRGVQLATMNVSVEARGGSDAWPTRCYAPADALRTALQNEPGAPQGETDFAKAARELADVLRNDPDAVSRDLSPLVDAVWKQADQRKIQRVSTSTKPAPDPVRAETIGDWKGTVLQKTPFALKNLFFDLHPSGTRWAIVDDAAYPQKLLCAFPGDRDPSCAPLPRGVPLDAPPYRLLATIDGESAPLIFTGRRGVEGIYRAKDGKKIGGTFAYGGVVRDDGFAAVVGWSESEKNVQLLRQPTGADAIVTTLTPPANVGNYFYSTTLLWDWVLFRGGKDDGVHVFAQRVKMPDGSKDEGVDDPLDLGMLEEIGKVEDDETTPHIVGCRAGDSTFVRVKGWDADEVLAVSKGDLWSKPMHLGRHDATLTCRPGELAATWSEVRDVDGKKRIDVEQARCTSSGCTQAFASIALEGAAAPREGSVDAFDVAGKSLVVWIAGDRGGVRMRLAPIDRLADAPDRVLLDDLGPDGRSDLYDVRAVPIPNGAVVLMSTKNGVFTSRFTE